MIYGRLKMTTTEVDFIRQQFSLSLESNSAKMATAEDMNEHAFYSAYEKEATVLSCKIVSGKAIGLSERELLIIRGLIESTRMDVVKQAVKAKGTPEAFRLDEDIKLRDTLSEKLWKVFLADSSQDPDEEDEAEEGLDDDSCYGISQNRG